MWFDDLAPGAPWTSLWYGYILCNHCRGIRRLEATCPVCNDGPPVLEGEVRMLPNGNEVRISVAFMGAEGRYEDYLYLQMLEREWKRPVLESDSSIYPGTGKHPSPRAAIVLLFW